jgi:clathrin heavy chain
MFSQYDKVRIAQLCEKSGMYQRALENYREINDIRRVIINAPGINPDFLIAFFGHMTPNNALQCLYDLMKANRQANMQIVIQAAVKYQEQLTVTALIQMFEQFGSFDGLFYFLGSILTLTEDPDVHFKYIEAAAKLNQTKEVERVIRETKFYDPVRVKDFLKDIRLPDPRPLIYLCDIHDFVEELTRYLYKNNQAKYIEVYLMRVNPNAAPKVLGTLEDLDCDENYVKQLLNSMRASCPVEPLVEEMEKRNKLKVIQGWLEDRGREGSQNTALHTALAKIYVDINKDPETFLLNNRFYDSKIVGKYCEDRDPHLAVTAYKRAWGECDEELIDVTNKNALYRIQARYLVERQSLELWAKVLDGGNKHRRSVIDQVVASALPDSKNPEEVSCTVKAFIKAELPNELIELLEKIVLHNSDFSNNRNLQNLLILTAIKSDQSRVIDYINRLDNYDAPELAKIALGQYNLYEEAFLIYRKAGMNEEAIEVLISHVENLDRAKEFAEKIASPDVWSRLAKAMLEHGIVADAVAAYIKAQDTSNYLQVIAAAEGEGLFDKLIPFLLLARKQQLHQKDSTIDSELIFCLAKTNKLAELEDFLNQSNQADIGNVGDRCYNEKLYEAGRLLFLSINNWGKLASCLVKLKRFVEALEAAKKANTPKTWKEVNFACVVAKEFKLAAMAGLNIIIHPDHLEELIQHYERFGCTDELIALIESGIAHERSHIGIFTELGILYAKYKGEKLMDHCRNYFARLNIPKLLRACERYKMWSEAVFLYVKYDEFDNAIQTMMEHSPAAWSHEIFTQVIQKATNQDLFYKAGLFYLEEQPMQVNDLLKTISSKVDHAKMVQVIRKTGHLALILPWMQSVQMYNVAAVNEAVNELLLELEDFETLRQSVTDFENFDQIALAQKIERHSLMEMRRIAAFLYRRNQRYAQSLALSKQDEIYKDAMETARDSQTPELAEELLTFFVTIRDKEAFCACSFVCYELLKPDVVMEAAWRAGYFDFAMPFFIQNMRDMTLRLNALEKKTEAKEKKEEEKAEQQAHAPLETMDAISMMMPQLNSLPALGPSIPGMGMMSGMPGMNPMMTGMGGMPGMPGMGGMPGMPGMFPTGYVDPMTMMSQQYQPPQF